MRSDKAAECVHGTTYTLDILRRGTVCGMPKIDVFCLVRRFKEKYCVLMDRIIKNKKRVRLLFQQHN